MTVNTGESLFTTGDVNGPKVVGLEYKTFPKFEEYIEPFYRVEFDDDNLLRIPFDEEIYPGPTFDYISFLDIGNFLAFEESGMFDKQMLPKGMLPSRPPLEYTMSIVDKELVIEFDNLLPNPLGFRSVGIKLPKEALVDHNGSPINSPSKRSYLSFLVANDDELPFISHTELDILAFTVLTGRDGKNTIWAYQTGLSGEERPVEKIEQGKNFSVMLNNCAFLEGVIDSEGRKPALNDRVHLYNSAGEEIPIEIYDINFDEKRQFAAPMGIVSFQFKTDEVLPLNERYTFVIDEGALNSGSPNERIEFKFETADTPTLFTDGVKALITTGIRVGEMIGIPEYITKGTLLLARLGNHVNYQWYIGDSENIEEATPIVHGTYPSLKIDDLSEGKYLFFKVSLSFPSQYEEVLGPIGPIEGVLSDIAFLSNIELMADNVNYLTDFDPNNTEYDIVVPAWVDEIRVFAEGLKPMSTIDIDNWSAELFPGDDGVLMPLTFGENSFTVTVFAPDGETSRDYTINIVRDKNTGRSELAPNVRYTGIEDRPYRVGEVIEAVYLYEDDLERAEGQSQFQWYRYDDANEDYTLIEGANQRTYNIQLADEGHRLTFGVMPVSEDGVEGSIEYSAKSQIVQAALPTDKTALQSEYNLVDSVKASAAYIYDTASDKAAYDDALAAAAAVLSDDAATQSEVDQALADLVAAKANLDGVDDNAGDDQTGDDQTGDDQTGDGQTDDDQTGDDQTGDGQTDDDQTGDDQTGDDQTGDDQTGDDQTGDDQTGDDQTGDDQTGDDQSNNRPPVDTEREDDDTDAADDVVAPSNQSSIKYGHSETATLGSNGKDAVSIANLKVVVPQLAELQADLQVVLSTEREGAAGIGNDFNLAFVAAGESLATLDHKMRITLSDQALPQGYIVYHVATDGELTPLALSEHSNGTISFMTRRTGDFRVLPKAQPKFVDLFGHWAATAVRELAERAVIKGYPDAKFKPDEALKRGDFVLFIDRFLEFGDGVFAEFSDVQADDYYAAAVFRAAQLGIVKGVGGGLFAPQSTVTRQDALTILYRGLKVFNLLDDKMTMVNPTERYSDAAAIKDYAVDAVSYFTANGIVEGANGQFSPQRDVTRAELATILLRLSDQLLAIKEDDEVVQLVLPWLWQPK